MICLCFLDLILPVCCRVSIANSNQFVTNESLSPAIFSNRKLEVMDTHMKLHVWQGDWGLPSVDHNCLAALAYCKFSGVPVEVKKTGNPWRSPTGHLPALHHNENACSKVTDIFSYLKKEHWGSDFELSSQQSADVIAYSSMLEEKLLPALLYLWWMDAKTYVEVTRPCYSSAMPFPLNYFLPQRKQKAAELRVTLTKGRECISEQETETMVYREAKECLNLLSYKLAENRYMFGQLPSSLDALIFGYLAPILRAPLTGNPLQTHLQQCDNLCRLCNSILTTFFPADIREADSKKREKSSKKTKVSSPDMTDFPYKRRNMVLGAVFALTVMIGYAFSSGLVQIQILDDDARNEPNSKARAKERQRES